MIFTSLFANVERGKRDRTKKENVKIAYLKFISFHFGVRVKTEKIFIQ